MSVALLHTRSQPPLGMRFLTAARRCWLGPVLPRGIAYPGLAYDPGLWRHSPSLQLLALRSYPLIERLHHLEERRIAVPEGRIIPRLLDQRRRHASL